MTTMTSHRDDDGNRGSGIRAAQQRGEPRYDVTVPAVLPEWRGSNRNCVIKDVSRDGLRIELVRRNRADLHPAHGLHRGAMVPLSAVLPGGSERVSTQARVMHLSLKGNRLSMGLRLRDASQPLTRELLRALGLVASSTVSGHEPAADPHPEQVERYLATVRGELMDRAGAPPADSGAFLGLVVVHNSESALREALGEAVPEDLAALRVTLHAAVAELRVDDGVREVMLQVFDRVFLGPRGPLRH
jgi:hypothetical protein